MNYYIDIQNASEEELPLTEAQITEIAILTLKDHRERAELTIRLVPPIVIQHLNSTYRHKNKATNVLAFPSSLPEAVELEYPLLGDIIICPQVLRDESIEQKKSLDAHWSLILIHGVLHLLGYDHIKDEDAALMQAIEVKLLNELGYENPYDEDE
ncbi:MAG: rRNA maturation RNase YbeY [Legionella sp.]|jgi:probable rRNA maturation factor